MVSGHVSPGTTVARERRSWSCSTLMSAALNHNYSSDWWHEWLQSKDHISPMVTVLCAVCCVLCTVCLKCVALSVGQDWLTGAGRNQPSLLSAHNSSPHWSYFTARRLLYKCSSLTYFTYIVKYVNWSPIKEITECFKQCYQKLLTFPH